jgi:four helix bundle protein
MRNLVKEYGTRDAGRGAREEENGFMDELRWRTKRFAVDTIQLVERLGHSVTESVIGKQLLRSGTSVGANYRAAKRAKSNADFISKMGIVEEEADECLYWLELLVEAGKISQDGTNRLSVEANRILGMTVNSIKTARSRSSS